MLALTCCSPFFLSPGTFSFCLNAFGFFLYTSGTLRSNLGGPSVALKDPLNHRQVEVLRWISEGCPDDRWTDFTYKTTASALQSRRLVEYRSGVVRGVRRCRPPVPNRTPPPALGLPVLAEVSTRRQTTPYTWLLGQGAVVGRCRLKFGRDGLELRQRRRQVLDDLSGDDLGRREVVGILQRLVAQPGDVEVDLVPGE